MNRFMSNAGFLHNNEQLREDLEINDDFYNALDYYEQTEISNLMSGAEESGSVKGKSENENFSRDLGRD